jgi:DNA-binding transcriptional regulator GbsR (MarR family)
MKTENIHQYMEDFGLLFEQFGLSRMLGRLLAWLLICEPPHQTMPEMVEALHASKSSVSTTVRMLEQLDLIERISLPGIRADYFRLKPDVWIRLVESKLAQFSVFRRFATRGLDLLEGEPPARRQALEHMQEAMTFFEREFRALLDRWKAEHAADRSSDSDTRYDQSNDVHHIVTIRENTHDSGR